MSQADRILEASRYVAAAYGILWVALVAYLIMLGTRVSKLHKELTLLAEVVERRDAKKGQ